jgi:hypothetical protein
MNGLLESKPVSFDDAVKKLLSGWTTRPLEQSFYRGGTTYRHAIDSLDGETRIVSDLEWKYLSRWVEVNGKRAIIKRAGQNYLVRGKSGEIVGHLWKDRSTWILQRHASPSESFDTAKLAKSAAMKYALKN